MKKLLFLLLVFSTLHTRAQTTTPTINGAYYLQDVMEVGSGFNFNADHSFEFFFSYGALDRAAKGTWEQHGDTIILMNAKKPPLDFKLVQAKATGSGQVTIKIKDKNDLLLRNIYAGLKTADTIYRDVSNGDGDVVFEKCKVESISLLHEFFPERFSIFPVTNADADYFEFTIEPWIADVAFDRFILILKDGTLTGAHPLLKPGAYTYTH